MTLKKNRLAKKLDIAGKQARYDASAKSVLSDKSVLAHILKECVSEFKEYDTETIKSKYIEAEVRVSEVAVDDDAQPEDIRGRAVELNSVAEGLLVYDIIFDVKIPDPKKEKCAIINIEAQKKYNVGYPIPKRADYYTGRLVSSQKGTIFRKSDYGKLRKVISIWIIMEVCDKKKNSITVYDMNERQVCGNFKVSKQNYDMQTMIMIGLGDHTKTENRLLKILDILFAKDISAPEKQKLLEQMGIAMTEETKEEVNEMCNLGEGIYEQGIEKGIEQGIERGENKLLAKMIASGKLTLEEISEITGVELNAVKQISEYNSRIKQAV